MGKPIKPGTGTEHLIESSIQFYRDLLGYAPEQTSLQEIPQNQWKEFTTRRGLNPNSSGIYMPRNQAAIIQEGDRLSLFHEYFGHGLYCEQSLSGKELVNLERKLLEEEQQQFSTGKFTLEDIQEYRKQNQSFRELEEFRKQNLITYETFAIWTEHLLSEEHELGNQFEKKYSSLFSPNQETIDSIINFSNRYGNLATFYEMGLARQTTPTRAANLIRGIYGREAIDDSRLIMLTGSKKPFSDIDLFSSSEHLYPIKNNWLDLVNFGEADFERRLKLFEIQVTYPIMKGEFVAGDKGYLRQKREQLENQPITEEAIQHNFEKAKRNKDFAKTCINGSEDEKISLSYSETHLANAIALKNGIRIFSKEDLEDTEIFNKMKGGII